MSKNLNNFLSVYRARLFDASNLYIAETLDYDNFNVLKDSILEYSALLDDLIYHINTVINTLPNNPLLDIIRDALLQELRCLKVRRAKLSRN